MGGGGFTFKRFHIDHSLCAMKVGTDGVLIGSWCRLPEGRGRVLDIGTGTGLIAVMAAQRSPHAEITAIDIDSDCVRQAWGNAAASPWGDRIRVEECSLQAFAPQVGFDAIVSNPPYFEESLLPPDSRRTAARHTLSLPFRDLAAGAARLLAAGGVFSLILPAAEAERFLAVARGRLFLRRRCEVRSTPSGGVKRVMMELSAEVPAEPPVSERLVIGGCGPQVYSGEYRALTRDFYLKF